MFLSIVRRRSHPFSTLLANLCRFLKSHANYCVILPRSKRNCKLKRVNKIDTLQIANFLSVTWCLAGGKKRNNFFPISQAIAHKFQLWKLIPRIPVSQFILLYIFRIGEWGHLTPSHEISLLTLRRRMRLVDLTSICRMIKKTGKEKMDTVIRI